jgi:hypothetical protein
MLAILENLVLLKRALQHLKKDGMADSEANNDERLPKKQKTPYDSINFKLTVQSVLPLMKNPASSRSPTRSQTSFLVTQ